MSVPATRFAFGHARWFEIRHQQYLPDKWAMSFACFTAPMNAGRSLRQVIGQTIHDTRLAVGWTKQVLADRAGVSRAMVGLVEAYRVNVSVDTAGKLLDALGVNVDVAFRRPYVASARQVDAAHARCVAYVQRRLESAGWLVKREVEIVHGRSHGWIDILAFDPTTRTLLVIEVKTEIRDLGLIERTLSWYGREAWAVARARGWRPTRVRTALLVLATDANDDRLRSNREALAQTFPDRAMGLLDSTRACLALIDPRSRRRDWLLRARIDGRRTPAPYRDYADFVHRI